MNKYTIYCTKEQTHKALELGAPIEINNYVSNNFIIAPNHKHKDWTERYVIPTAEQIIGWLEEQGIYGISIEEFEGDWIYHIRIVASTESINNEDYPYNSRKEATLAAIDAALDYLKSNENEK